MKINSSASLEKQGIPWNVSYREHKEGVFQHNGCTYSFISQVPTFYSSKSAVLEKNGKRRITCLATDIMYQIESDFSFIERIPFLMNDKCEEEPVTLERKPQEKPEQAFASGFGGKAAQEGFCFDIIPLESGGSTNTQHLFHHWFHCQSLQGCNLTWGEQVYLIPGNSSFLMCDLFEDPYYRWAYLLRSHSQFKLIVMDPPWPNKSAKRAKKYKMLPKKSLDDLARIPLQLLMDTEWGCIVAVWITNDPEIEEFVREELFQIWDLTYLATWIWVKVTACGNLISRVNNPRRKPFEKILVGFRPGIKGQCGGNGTPTHEQVPNHAVVSVPREHSRKPSLEAQFAPLIPEYEQAQKLEMFAREIFPGWTSIGNEVLKFQNELLFQKVPEHDYQCL